LNKKITFDQLIQAGRDSRDILAKRNIIKSDDESLIDSIIKDPNSPVLPGGGLSKSVRPYLPTPWTINACRRIVYDIARIWQSEIKKHSKYRGSDFFTFVLRELNRVESNLNKEINKKLKENDYNFGLLSRKDTINAIKLFFVDSFAISVVAKSHSDMVDYLKWFDGWTKDLLKLWPDNLKSIDSKMSKEDKNESREK
jgi:hypothetical protein